MGLLRSFWVLSVFHWGLVVSGGEGFYGSGRVACFE